MHKADTIHAIFRHPVTDVLITDLQVLLNCQGIDTLRPRQNGHYFPDDMFKYIFFNRNTLILIKIWLKFVPN